MAMLTLLTEAFAEMSDLVAQRHGLSVGECQALGVLAGFDAITAVELGSRCRMNKTKVSRIMRSLEKRGLLTCDRNNLDHRKVKLTLTPRGVAAGRDIAAAGAFLDELLKKAPGAPPKTDVLRVLDELIARIKAVRKDTLSAALGRIAS